MAAVSPVRGTHMHEPEIGFEDLHDLLLVLQAADELALAHCVERNSANDAQTPAAARLTGAEGEAVAFDGGLDELRAKAPAEEDAREVGRNANACGLLWVVGQHGQWWISTASGGLDDAEAKDRTCLIETLCLLDDMDVVAGLGEGERAGEAADAAADDDHAQLEGGGAGLGHSRISGGRGATFSAGEG